LPDGERESFRHDADYRRRCRSEPHDTTDHRGIRAESHLPEAVSQNDDCGRLRRLVPVQKNAAQHGRNTRHPKSGGTDLDGIDGFASLLADGQVPLEQPECADVLEASRQLMTSYVLGSRPPDSTRSQ
jgi:hypothetical protein